MFRDVSGSTAIPPQARRTIFLASARTIAIVSADKVRSLPLPAAVTDISLGFGSGEQPIIYATSEHGIFVSKDGGANWNQSDLPGEGAKVRAIATSSSIRRRPMSPTII